MRILAGQLDRLKEVPTSDKLRVTIGEFPRMMEEVVNFISVAQKLVRCVFSCVKWNDNLVVGRSQTHPRSPS